MDRDTSEIIYRKLKQLDSVLIIAGASNVEEFETYKNLVWLLDNVILELIELLEKDAVAED